MPRFMNFNEKNDAPLVSIVVVTFNTYEHTERCLQSILMSNYSNFTVFLVDNGSKEEVFNEFYSAHKTDKNINFLRLVKNEGFGEGCNQAIRRIKEGYIIFLNNDTVVDKDWLGPLVRYMEKNPEVGACQPKIKDIRYKDYFEYAGAAGGFMDVYGFPFARGRIFFTLEKDKGQYDNIAKVVWCSGTAMITKKEVLEKTGDFDNIFFMYGEESDLCWRMHHVGYKLVIVPKSIVRHYGGGTMSRNPRYKKTFFSHRNGIILLAKNYSLLELLRYLPVRIFFDLVAFCYYLFSYPLNSLALTLAYMSMLVLIPRIVISRKSTNKVKKEFPSGGNTNYPLYGKSIIVDYFLRRKKTFSSLNFSLKT